MAHGGFLRQHCGDPEYASHIIHDYRQADLDPQTRAILDYAVKLTLTPAGMAEADIEHLRSVGLTDEQVLSTAAITCVFNFMNRLADGLGVEIPEGREAIMGQWLSDAAKQAQDWLLTPDAATMASAAD